MMPRSLAACLLALAVTVPAASWAALLSEPQAAELAVRAILQRHWTNLPRECLSLEPMEPAYTFQVRENHGGECGGDALLAPRLFTVHVDAQSGQVRQVEANDRP